MILKELLERSEYTLVQGSEDVEISTLVYDSRKIEKGSVFVCISGAAFDGHKFVAQAAELGAAAVVVEKDVEVPENLTVIKFDNTRLALAEMSAAYFGYPSEELTNDSAHPSAHYLLCLVPQSGKTNVPVVHLTIQIQPHLLQP